MRISQLIATKWGGKKNQDGKVGMENMPTVKIVAVAKDEAAYIPEWVHHHTYFGFNAIDIYINRTTDNSWDVVRALQKTMPHVSCYSADWVDTCPAEAKHYLQFIVYAKAFEEEKKAQKFDYIMFLDIDEFWTPSDMQSSIQDYIKQQPEVLAMSFGWFNEHGDTAHFQPIKYQSSGQLSPLVKTLISLKADISEVGLHQSQLSSDKVCLVDGDSFISSADNKECLHQDLIKIRTVMILHRMFRSPMEYISMLSRGRPSDSLALKLNRGGYNKASGTHTQFVLHEEAYLVYINSLTEFLGQENLLFVLEPARRFVCERYNTTLNSMGDLPIENLIRLFDVFKGCDDQVMDCLVETISQSASLQSCKDASLLLTLAEKVRRYNSALASDIWSLSIGLQ
ncbi:MAG: hypothetical protein ACJASL_001497 [Paraglaciecola sp.]